MKKENLIITGWGYKDYAYAAALALRHFNYKADVFGKRTWELPEYLDTVKGYQNIIIIGVGVTANPARLLEALKKLKVNGSNVSWLSWMVPPESIYENLKKSSLEIFMDDQNESGTILETVARCYDIKKYDDLKKLLVRNPEEDNIRQYHQLIEAADYFNRNRQNNKSYQKYDEIAKDTFYGAVIQHIARQDNTLTPKEKELLTLYIQYGARELVGNSPQIQELQKAIDMAAQYEHARVYISGETGTGKETVAQQIHHKSKLSNGPFIAFNCASVTPSLLQDHFFGHVEGAFTDARTDKKGLFEQADGGTLFLDEIAELPLDAQSSLLRVLEENRFTRIGSSEEIYVNVRLITATNCDLAAMVHDKKFRMDLFFRLNVLQVHTPALREHPEDIEAIANGYWKQNQGCKLPDKIITILKNYSYPGNVRELKNILERTRVMFDNQYLDADTDLERFKTIMDEHKKITASLLEEKTDIQSEKLDDVICKHVKHIYEKYNHNLAKTAKVLEIAQNTVRKYLALTTKCEI